MKAQEQIELEYLQYFYSEVYYALGPAAGDVYRKLAERYEGELPEGYEEDE